jgi:hypothetical protein
MKLVTHIRNLIFLYRENRKETAVDLKIDVSELIGRVNHNYKRKNSWVRNQVALLIRKIRKEKPYKEIDYSKAKEFYENQPEPIDFSKVKEGSYVVKFTEEYAVKGKRWCEYYINFTSGTGVFKVGKWDDKWGYFRLEDYRGEDGIYSLDMEDDRKVFRFATKEEIEQFKIARKNYKQKKKEINTLQEQITKLYKEL